MKIYKVVPCANAIVINKKESAQNAIVKFYDVIAQECVDGWEFHSMVDVFYIRPHMIVYDSYFPSPTNSFPIN